MGAYNYIKESFEKSRKERNDTYRQRIALWAKQGTVVRVENPTNPVKAKALGYKAKKEFIIARVRIKKGKRARRKPDLGRKPGRQAKFRNPGRSLDFYAINKAQKRFPNLNALNAYLVGENGQSKFYEVVLKDENDHSPRGMWVAEEEAKAVEVKAEVKKAAPKAAAKPAVAEAKKE